ncbi:MAG: hypothetical protein J7J98_06140 [candidate division Zixibacteria bacterium]|nr:hypothetical protein [candidate division Zixibacteria bacterium]
MTKKSIRYLMIILVMSYVACNEVVAADKWPPDIVYSLPQYSYGHDIQVYGVGIAGPKLFFEGAIEWNYSTFPILWVRKDGIARFDLQPAINVMLYAVWTALKGVSLCAERPSSSEFHWHTAIITLPNSIYKFRLRKNWQLTVGMNTHYLFINKAEQDRGVLLRPMIGMTNYSDHSFMGRGGWTFFVAYNNFWNWEGSSVSHGWSVGAKMFFELRGH